MHGQIGILCCIGKAYQLRRIFIGCIPDDFHIIQVHIPAVCAHGFEHNVFNGRFGVEYIAVLKPSVLGFHRFEIYGPVHFAQHHSIT